MHSSNFIDLSGQKFGRLTVIKYLRTEKKSPIWLCECSCGNTTEARTNALRRGTKTSCGCYKREQTSKRRTKDITGNRYGNLVAIKYLKKNEKHQALWDCVCDCGNHRVVTITSLTAGDVTSCGCITRQKIKEFNTTHDGSYTILYNKWAQMKNRCFNPNAHNYQYYGARGISVCAEWVNSFEVFRDWALENGYSEDLTIERIDTNGNYEPSNCRWATVKEQNNNRRNNVFTTYHGERMTIAQVAEASGIPYKKVRKMVNDGKIID